VNDLSNINIQSNSYRNDNRSFNNGQSISKIKKYDESNYISTLDSILEANEEGGGEKYNEEYYKEYKSKELPLLVRKTADEIQCLQGRKGETLKIRRGNEKHQRK
jgi:hypothetical protein